MLECFNLYYHLAVVKFLRHRSVMSYRKLRVEDYVFWLSLDCP